MILISFGAYVLYSLLILVIAISKLLSEQKVMWALRLHAPILIVAIDPMTRGDTVTILMWGILLIYAVVDVWAKHNIKNYGEVIGWSLASTIVVCFTTLSTFAVILNKG